MKKSFFMMSLLLMSLWSCKDKDTSTPTEEGETKENKTALHLLMKQNYFWYTYVPQSIDYSQYSSLNDELTALMYTKYDKWSFIIDTTTYRKVFEEGSSADYGMSFTWKEQTLYISQVRENSPAKAAGIKRGSILTAINGKSVLKLTQADAENIFQSKAGVQAVFSISYKNVSKDYSLTTAEFTAPTVYRDTVITTAKNNKVGYLAYSSFIDPSKSEFDKAFQYLSQNAITELILDLRDNGGGSLDVANYLLGYISPSSATGKTSIQLKYNVNLQKHDTSFVFSKRGSLDLKRIFILANKGSASASELVINSLKPHTQVIQIGSNTHGKPVGMNGFLIGKNIIFPITFAYYNSNGGGEFFSGLEPTYSVIDDFAYDFGNPSELLLKTALYYIDNGNYPSVALSLKSTDILTDQMQEFIDKSNHITGLINTIKK